MTIAVLTTAALIVALAQRRWPGLLPAGSGDRRRLRRAGGQDGRDDQDARAGGVFPQHDRPGGVHRRAPRWSPRPSATAKGPSGDGRSGGNRLELALALHRRHHLQRLGHRLWASCRASTSSGCSRARRCSSPASTCQLRLGLLAWCSSSSAAGIRNATSTSSGVPAGLHAGRDRSSPIGGADMPVVVSMLNSLVRAGRRRASAFRSTTAC